MELFCAPPAGSRATGRSEHDYLSSHVVDNPPKDGKLPILGAMAEDAEEELDLRPSVRPPYDVVVSESDELAKTRKLDQFGCQGATWLSSQSRLSSTQTAHACTGSVDMIFGNCFPGIEEVNFIHSEQTHSLVERRVVDKLLQPLGYQLLGRQQKHPLSFLACPGPHA
jgi:hypothetical protein